MAQNVCEGRDQKSCGATGWIADTVSGLRIYECGNEVDNVARGPELTVGAGSRKLAEKVLIHIDLEVLTVVSS